MNGTHDDHRDKNQSSGRQHEKVWDKNDTDWKNKTSKDHEGKRWGKNGTRNGTHERNGTADLDADRDGPKNWTFNGTHHPHEKNRTDRNLKKRDRNETSH